MGESKMGEKVELSIDPFGPCVYCTDEGKAMLNSRGVVEHMTVFKRQDGHIHVHGPIKNESLIIEMIQAICGEVDIGVGFKADDGDEVDEKQMELSEKGSKNPMVESTDSEDRVETEK
jgi:hypothetical protein